MPIDDKDGQRAVERREEVARLRVIELINPIPRGWVNYFAGGAFESELSFVKDWVEKKVRRHLMSARKRKSFGWQRWSRRWLYDELVLIKDYRVRRLEVALKANPACTQRFIPAPPL